MLSLPWLRPDSYAFPPVESALTEPDGLLAAGGDLLPERLINAYRQGIFPWFNEDQPILWWSPDPRCVLFPNELHLSRSLRKRLRRGDYRVTFDHAFADVITACGTRPDEGTWITDSMRGAYLQLHEQGVAHSVEVWIDNALAGGLYGIAIGGVFFGESMFSHQTNGSKIAFAHLIDHLQRWGYRMVDCQVHNNHLTTLGAREISRDEFCNALSRLTALSPQHNWVLDRHYWEITQTDLSNNAARRRR